MSATKLDRAWPRSNASDIGYHIIVDRWYPFLELRQPAFVGYRKIFLVAIPRAAVVR
jgi:hypothetical protein